MLEYKGFQGEYSYDKSSGLYHGEVIVIRDVVTFQAARQRDMEKEFRNSVDDYLSFCMYLDRYPR